MGIIWSVPLKAPGVLGCCACSVLYSFPSNIGEVVESPIECHFGWEDTTMCGGSA